MASPIMIIVEDDSGKQWLINLQYVEVVQFPSTQPAIQNNLNVEKVVMQGGEVIALPIGTWASALADLYAEFNDNPQPMENVKGQLYIMPQL